MKLHLYLILILVFPATIFSQVPPDPVLQPGEEYTDMASVSIDYQSPGSVRYLIKDPANDGSFCAIMMAMTDSSYFFGGAQKCMMYSYSYNFGGWISDRYPFGFPQEYPCISLRNGNPIFCYYQSGVGMRVFEDILFGAYSFIEHTGVSNPVLWGQITGTTNGKVILAASASDGSSFRVQAARFLGDWDSPIYLPKIYSSSGSYTVASGSNGIVGVFGLNENEQNKIYYYRSTDNGISFDTGTMIFDYQISGSDTLFANPVGGLQAIYLGDNPHLVFTVYNTENTVFPNPYTTAFISPRILHWSPSTGINIVADKNNIPDLTDTITNSFAAPLCQPSIGIDLEKIIISYTAYLRGKTQIVDNGDLLNAGEIMVSYSGNGTTWSNPFNLTNTANIEEKYSSLLNEPTDLNQLNITFLRDMKAGNWVQNPLWGKAPVYSIFIKKTISVGIQQNTSTAESFDLLQNYPNPFNPSTEITFSLNRSGLTSLIVYDARGREIAQLVNEVLSEGSYTYSFDTGKYNLPSGVYFYKLTSGENSKVNKMMLVR